MGTNDQRNRKGRPDNNGGPRNNNGRFSELKDTGEYYGKLKTQGYYLDSEKKKLAPDFIVKYGRDIASNLDMDGGSTKNKRTQIRKYYDYLIRVNQKLERMNMDYTYVVADVAELLPKVRYAMSRNVVSNEFVKFIEKNVEAVQDAKDFKAFLKHFEAIVAYMKKDTK